MWVTVRLIATLLFVLLPLLPAVAQPRVSMIGIPKGSEPSEAAARRVTLANNLQFMVVPRKDELFDPVEFAALWNGTPARSFAYYPTPDFALVFVSLTVDEIEDGGKLEIRGKTLETGKRFSKSFAIDRPSTATVVLETPKASSQILNEDGLPFAGARFFGQRRGDLFAIADEDGQVGLTSYERNTPEPHLAWAPGFWAESYDPRTTPTIQLERAPRGVQGQMIPWDEFPASADGRHVEVLVTDEEGRPIPNVLVQVDRTWWTRGDDMGRVRAFTRPGSDQAQLIVLASGFRSRAVAVKIGEGGTRLALPRKQPPAPAASTGAK